MAARSRPRAGQLKEEIDEERTLWSQIRADAKRVDHLMVQSDAISKKIVELTEQQTAVIARGESPSSSIDADLEKNLRENIRLSEEIQNLIADESGGNDILKSLEILSALRDAHEPDPIPTSRAASVGKSQRDRQTKRKHTDALDDRESIAADSPGGGPSPKVMINTTKDRLMKQVGSRASSVPAVRESSVKVEDAEGADQTKAHDPKPRLTVHTEVLYRNNKSRSLEGEGILCRVTSVIGEGKQRRYEIIDSDPDPPVPAQPYRASVNHLIPIPPANTNASLADLKTGKHVLALYPGTTTFYKAEVVAGWSAKGIPEEYVRLRFEGEDEADREMNVERRFVLPDR
ncbi:uncharacterized protein BDR25DRAFT_288052 [Lindgomyces ingoldianus]|uniref:Uncharacterized protein n=1 Tax=Lindgomyces ingoldianus TaxID=673940 RepID=A0ACB6QVM4_9PLEO|nr:uncharacterized protein BDR25DRAFT_288052 [Lindgomyces ingoldianus]KAF2470241.1 hypothetical protein BDR25DRAFT_288052 [Lindgomyces ingoldianus]